MKPTNIQLSELFVSCFVCLQTGTFLGLETRLASEIWYAFRMFWGLRMKLENFLLGVLLCFSHIKFVLIETCSCVYAIMQSFVHEKGKTQFTFISRQLFKVVLNSLKFLSNCFSNLQFVHVCCVVLWVFFIMMFPCCVSKVRRLNQVNGSREDEVSLFNQF